MRNALSRNLILLILATAPAFALDVDQLSDLIGYTIVASSQVRGTFEGADYDKPIILDNGMIFEFTGYGYAYAYRPTAVVFSVTFTPKQKAGTTGPPPRPITIYKLAIEDEIYDVRRIR